MVCWCWRENSIVVSVSGFVIGVRHLTNTTPTNKYNNYILKDLKPNINDIMCKNKSETVSEVHPDITIMRVELAINEREYGKKQIATLTVLRLQTHDRGEPHGVSRLVSCHATCEWSNGLIYCQMSTFAGLYSWEHGFQCRSFEMRTPDTMCAFVYVTYISHRIRFGSDGGTKKKSSSSSRGENPYILGWGRLCEIDSRELWRSASVLNAQPVQNAVAI